MKSLACNYTYWPGMDHDIENMVLRCDPCASAAKQPTKATLHAWPPVTKPWERIHIDYTGPHLGRYFLIIVDAFSKYPDDIPVSNMTPRQTVAVLRKVCAQNGAPETTVSDNGTQFTSQEFKKFCKTQLTISCHLRTIRSQMDESNVLWTHLRAASINCEVRGVWMKSWIPSC
jgi:transposase InsO family protein